MSLNIRYILLLRGGTWGERLSEAHIDRALATVGTLRDSFFRHFIGRMLLASLILFCMGVAHSQERSKNELNLVSPDLRKVPSINLVARSAIVLKYLDISEDPSIMLSDCSAITIYCVRVRSIRISNCKKIRIHNCYISDSRSCAIFLEKCEDVVIQGCRIADVASGLYALQSTGIKFIGNYVENVKGPYPRGQVVQFDKVFGAGNRVQDNYGVAFRGHSNPEDLINMFKSSGLPLDPILVENNYLLGDPKFGSDGKSPTGSGIMLGDKGGEDITCRKNILISPGQVGIGVAGGSRIAVEDNLVFGQASPVSNVGVYVWNQSDEPGGIVNIAGNQVHWTNKDKLPHSWWNGGGFNKVTLKENDFGTQISPDQIPSAPTTAPRPPQLISTQFPEMRIEVPWNE